ncbi:DUF4158 domain-containing protein [Aurantimonas sp. C2-6-R+9]|uniref:DUF4158 domain-containing protein n=1 Tax=unclassified Aurantimonas TaxID=2638230 RepID=UPI002E17DD51|nr:MULTISPECIES: DUF4158 domain-containing protein [unclassified Aurantimonas]MEC5293528.1 DUF4158 domain-containing protein [Aurantimonas sp. C2-3-R2]MEC5383530.1 DUF4158 domain-containing protein [Aurantimonas sp. C2-6-R+9]MEC5414307.1 DUF4158 domain-containing protein [Aurantimonas sp. C2-4-R8]
MDGRISAEDLAGQWSLSFSDTEFVNSKPLATRPGVAVQLKFFAAHGFFADAADRVPDDAIGYVVEQLGGGDLSDYDFAGRSGRRHRAEILRHLGFRRMKPADREALAAWISSELCPSGMTVGAMMDRVFLWCRDNKIFALSRMKLERLARSERQRFLDVYLGRVADRLHPDAQALMEASLADPDSETGFHSIKSDAGQASLDNIIAVTDRLAFIRSLDLPADLLLVCGTAWIEQIERRVGGEKASEMRRHPRTRQLGLYAVFLMSRQSKIIDAMIDLLIETVHRITTRSRRKVIAGIARDIEKIYGKERLLVDIAGAAIDNPSGRVCDVIFPVAGETKLTAIINEYHAQGALDRRIYKVMRGSYASHYRRMVPKLLSVLEFCSNNATWRPVVDAVDWMRTMVDDGRRFVSRQDVPIDKVVPAKWRGAVIGKDGRVNRISYELCVLSQLRESIRAKEIWIVGADRYRNPDDDLPKDFEAKPAAYYSSLNLTPDAKAFIGEIKRELEEELRLLNADLPGNDKVRILWRGENRICVTSFKPAPEPTALTAVKAEIGRRWPMTGLLDVLKEAALDTGYLDAFETSASRVALSRPELDRRLLLCLYGCVFHRIVSTDFTAS